MSSPHSCPEERSFSQVSCLRAGKGGEGWALHCQQQEEIATTAHLYCKFNVKPPALPVPSIHELRPTLGRAGGCYPQVVTGEPKGVVVGFGAVLKVTLLQRSLFFLC